MGWSAHDLPNEDYKLWTRGGTCGVYIQQTGREGPEIEIPSELLRMLVADDVRSKRISELEQMDDNEVLGFDGE